MPGKTIAPNTPRITKFTNCRLVRGSSLVEQDLWIDSLSGKILKDQEAFYELHLSPDEIIDLGGRILAPGLIDTQLNGAQGFDFSVPCATKEEYDEGLRHVNQGLARTGVTSYLPTLVSSTPEVYWQVRMRDNDNLQLLPIYTNIYFIFSRSSLPSAQQQEPTVPKTAPSPLAPTSKAPSSTPTATASTNPKSFVQPTPTMTSCTATALLTSPPTQPPSK